MRIAHWLIVASMLVLSATGIHIGRPVIIPAGEARKRIVMGTTKVIHFYAAIVFTMSVLARLIWMFTGNSYARWHQFVPVDSRRRRASGQSRKFYLFATPQDAGLHRPQPGRRADVHLRVSPLPHDDRHGLRHVPVERVGHSVFRGLPFLDPPLRGSACGALDPSRRTCGCCWGFMVHHVYSAMLMSQVERQRTWSRFSRDTSFSPQGSGHAG